MRMKLLIAIVGLTAVLLMYPSFNEDTQSGCGALEVRSLRLLAQSSGEDPAALAIIRPLLGVGSGEYAKEIVKSEYSSVPSGMGCSVMYWHSMIDPGGYTEKLAVRLQKLFNY